MLSNLDIKNIAVIESLSFAPEVGMTVLTGETGAGKSVIIDSVNIILGARTNKNLVRYGTDRARVSAMLTPNSSVCKLLSENGIDVSEELVISREITADGKSVSRINGTMVPVSLLRDVGRMLINIHGQHDNQALLDKNRHIEFLDAYAEIKDLSAEYSELYRQMRECEKELEALTENEQNRLARIDLLKYQTEELEAAALQIGEEEELREEAAIMTNSEKITQAVGGAFSFLYETEGNAYDRLSSAISALGEVSSLDERLSAMYERISDAMYTVEDASHELRSYLDEVEYDPVRLDEISQRLDLIKKLERKYGPTIGECLDYFEKSSNELEGLINHDEKTAELTEKLDVIKRKLSSCADKLTAERKRAAKKLSSEIEDGLHELDMEKAVFCVDIQKNDTFNKYGCDSVEFMFSANPGLPPRQLAEIASGGELSRVMLAMKTVLAQSDEVDTLIFDEIDTGVSGSAAQKIAKKLSLLGKHKQVICISHQPQLAAIADYNYKIEKSVREDMAVTDIRLLNDEERVNELARIIDGSNITKTSLEHAREMLNSRAE